MALKRSRVTIGLMISGLSAAFASPTAGAPLTFQFGGVIDFVEQGLPIPDQLTVGVPYSGVYVFDPVGVSDINDDPRIGTYEFGSAGFMSVDISDVNFSTLDLLIAIWNLSPTVDIYQAGSSSPFSAHSVLWRSMALDLRDATHAVFDSDALPLYAPDLSTYPNNSSLCANAISASVR